MKPAEIKYYREKACQILGAKYSGIAWGALDAFTPMDDTIEQKIRTMNKFKPRPEGVQPYVRIISPYKPPAETGIFTEQVEEVKGILSQPNARTCQSACCGMATGRSDVMTIRAELEAIGEPGDPGVMGSWLRKRLGDRYIFDDNASMSEIREWLRNGEFLITHGWFTGSGHVIGLDGITLDPTKLSYKISVKDPWSEFSFSSWSYDNPSATSYDGDYSAHGLYAAIVAGQGVSDAIAIYQRGELDSNRKGAWIHRILPAKK